MGSDTILKSLDGDVIEAFCLYLDIRVFRIPVQPAQALLAVVDVSLLRNQSKNDLLVVVLHDVPNGCRLER